jgi:hypothetical protein
MPASTQKQKRFFGAILGYKHGQLKNPSEKLKKAAGSISEASAEDFASSVVKKRKDLAGQVASSMMKKRGRK